MQYAVATRRSERQEAIMAMIQDPSSKYRRFDPVGLTDRTWPDQVLTAPPIWCSVDLRDGNQALIEPMDRER